MSRLVARNHCFAVLIGVICLATSSCMQSPQERLLGRWYSNEMSIRFREDGSVLFNSEAGLARGRYFFDGTSRDLASMDPVPNLTLDVIRNGRHLRLYFVVDLLSNERIRLQQLAWEGPGQPRQVTPGSDFAILRNAHDEPSERTLVSRR